AVQSRCPRPARSCRRRFVASGRSLTQSAACHPGCADQYRSTRVLRLKLRRTGSRLAVRRCCCPRCRRRDGPQCPRRVRNRKAPRTRCRVVAVLLAPRGSVGEGTATTIGVNAWRTVRVGHDHRVAVRVLVQYLGRPVEFFLGDIETKVDGDEVQPAGGEQVVVVYVIVGTPWCVAGLGLLPTGSLFQRFVALGAKVLV